MHKPFFGYFLFAILVGALFMVLKFLNWVPMLLQKDTMRHYSNIQDIRIQLNMNEIYVPSYFPERLSWPPSEILAQSKPFPAVVMEFRDGKTHETILFVSQVSGVDRSVSEKKIEIVQIKERADYTLKGRKSLLVVGQCEDLKPCSQIAWQEGEFRIFIAMKSGPFDLIRIAESMIHE